jgi:hypothetical protein
MSADRQKSELGGLGLLGIGIFNVLCIAAGLGIGWLVDRGTGSGPVFTVIGLFGGVVLGIAGSWLQFRQYLKSDGSG